jgi:hypothetical protein
VAGELIDRPGDLDEFTLAGVPGQLVNIELNASDTNPEVIALLTKPSTGSVLARATGGPPRKCTGRLTLEDADYTVRVDANSANATNRDSHGAYTLRVVPIDPRPEGRSAEYLPGDTVSGEALAPFADIDEYTFTLADSTRLRIYWDSPVVIYAVFAFGTLRDDTSGQRMWWSSDNLTVPGSSFPHTLTFPPGRYRMSVEVAMAAVRFGGGGCVPSVPYRFALTPE